MEKRSREEISEAIYDVVKSFNLKNTDKGDPCYTMPDMLEGKNITTLRRMGKFHKVRGFSRMDKATIIPILIEKMTEKNRLSDCLFLIEKHEWDLFKKAVKTKEIIDDKLLSANYMFLITLGYLGLYYADGHFHYIVPAEVQAAYREIEKSGFPAEKEHAILLNDYAIAATNLYGVILQDDLVEIFNKQNVQKTSTDEMFSVLIRYVPLDYGYCFWKGYLVNDDFADNDFQDVEYFAGTAGAKPRYIPAKNQFLKYSDWDYIEPTQQISALQAYISRELTDDPDLAEDLTEEIAYGCKYETKMQVYIDMFEEEGILLSFEQIHTLAKLIVDVQNNTRLWLNNGHTPDEILSQEKKRPKPLQKELLRVAKIGRNDPCPCGSGKKYKKCCGR